ncbi:glutaredoxin family protein [Massilia sp. PAMC28688]|uniref:glutaredoxin family protein n=1 Tax=Massilia sp. PAMC28688 TaxID=2861283 RepID=UPI001C6259C8|nr:glutaredoxin family protein [Massilia sp. PAMC28688]QYF94745.1 glutaredoxin family protein [Massilia sp. PAMC28688]
MTSKTKRVLLDAVAMAATIAAAIAVGWQVPSLYQKFQGMDNERRGDFAQHVTQHRHRLTLYGTTTCPACAHARAHLVKAGIPFNDQVIDQSDAAKQMYQKLGERSVPILVSKTELLIGYNAAAYDRLVSR